MASFPLPQANANLSLPLQLYYSSSFAGLQTQLSGPCVFGEAVPFMCLAFHLCLWNPHST